MREITKDGLGVAALAMVVLFLLAACSRDDSRTDNKAETDPHVLLVVKTADNIFFNEIERGVRDTLGSAAKLTVRAGKRADDVDDQRRILESLVDSRDWHALLLTPSSSGTELIDILKQYSERGARIVIVDTAIDKAALDSAGFDIDYFVGSSNESGGRIAGEEIANIVSSTTEPKVLLLNGAESSETAQARRNGFLEVYKGEVLERTANWNRDEARDVVRGLALSGSKFDAIFAANDEMALGALLAYEETNEDAPPIIGFDATDFARKAVQDDRLHATIAQDPHKMGVEAATYAQKPVRFTNEVHLLDVVLVTE